MSAAGKGNPSAGHIHIKRKASEGGYSDVSATALGEAWFMPNWYRHSVGVAMEVYDIALVGDKHPVFSHPSNPWTIYIGIHVNRQRNMSADKSDLAFYIRHRNGAWGPALYSFKLYLLYGAHFNTKEFGARVDSFLNRALSVAGLEQTQGERRMLMTAVEHAIADFGDYFTDPRFKRGVHMAIAKQQAEALGAKFASNYVLYDKDGKPSGEYKEEWNGRQIGSLSSETEGA